MSIPIFPEPSIRDYSHQPSPFENGALGVFNRPIECLSFKRAYDCLFRVFAGLIVLLAPFTPLHGQAVQDLSYGPEGLPSSVAIQDGFDSGAHERASSLGSTDLPSFLDLEQFGKGTSAETARFLLPEHRIPFAQDEKQAGRDDAASGSSKAQGGIAPSNESLDLRGIYYKNKLEFGLDVGWLPINIPFVFDIFLGDAYNMTPLRYTLVPIVASLRWQMNDVSGPWILRGNWDMTVSGSFTPIPRGPESRYWSYDMGIRRNFVPHRGKIAPYFDGRLGLGAIDAKEPLGVEFAQGQNFTFTVNLGSGVRYNVNPRYAFSAGLNWMHISNLYLSEPKFLNYGINVYGPMFGVDVRLGKVHHTDGQ